MCWLALGWVGREDDTQTSQTGVRKPPHTLHVPVQSTIWLGSEPAYLGEVFDLARVLVFSWIYSDFNGAILLVVGDVPVDSEKPREYQDVSVQFFRGAHRNRVCVRVFMGISLRVCCKKTRSVRARQPLGIPA
jgi:hypothetical protein